MKGSPGESGVSAFVGMYQDRMGHYPLVLTNIYDHLHDETSLRASVRRANTVSLTTRRIVSSDNSFFIGILCVLRSRLDRLSSERLWAVTITMGTSRKSGSAAISVIMSQPDTPGMFRSKKIRSGLIVWQRRSPSLPSLASRTVQEESSNNRLRT